MRRCVFRPLVLLLFALFLVLPSPARLQAWEVVVTSPWLATITSFIGGAYVTVNPLYVWNSNGSVVRKTRVASIPKDRRMIALDADEARRLGLNAAERTNLVLLYRQVPLDLPDSVSLFSDPSVLPFISQRIFTALSGFDPANYPYYQRRLSEFQTRLDSTILVGRQLLKGYPVLDLTGEFSDMLLAAGCDLSMRDKGLLDAWARGEDLAGLLSTVKNAVQKKIPVVLDTMTAKKIRDALKNEKDIIAIGRPAEGQDLLLFFHDQYLFLWNKLAPLREAKQGKS